MYTLVNLEKIFSVGAKERIDREIKPYLILEDPVTGYEETLLQ
jgi:hypothetical protein